MNTCRSEETEQIKEREETALHRRQDKFMSDMNYRNDPMPFFLNGQYVDRWATFS